MNFERFAQFGLIFFFLISSYFLFKKKETSLFALLLLSFGLNGFIALFGTLWFPFKIVMIITSLWVVRKPVKYLFHDFFNIFFFLLIISVTIALASSPSIPGKTLLQGPLLRPLVQLYTYVSMILLIQFIVSIINTPERLQWSMKVYYRISEIIILIGLIHLFFLILNLNFLPILRPGGEDNLFAGFGFEGTMVNRVYGLSGEPKTLATFILPYIFISLYNFFTKYYNVNKFYHLIMLLISVLVMINTFSSAILISASIGLLIVPFLFIHRFGLKVLVLPVIIGLGFLGFSLFGNLFSDSIINTNEYEFNLANLLYERSFGRIDEEADTRFETIALEQIFNKDPQFLLTGYGLGMYNYHLPLSSHSRGVEPIDSGWVVILLDLGFFGLIFFFGVFVFLNKLKNLNRTLNSNILDSFIIGAIVGFLSHIGNNGLYQIFLFTGLSIAAYQVINWQKQILESQKRDIINY